MRKLIVVVVVLSALVGCKKVDVLFPIPIRIAGTVEVDDSTATFRDSTFIPSSLLGAEIRDRAEEAGIEGVYLESVVLVVERSGCSDATEVDGTLSVSLQSQSSRVYVLGKMDPVYPNQVVGDTLRPDLDSAGVRILNEFTQDALNGGSEIIKVIVSGTANRARVDFDVTVVVTFTLVVIREMTSIGL